MEDGEDGAELLAWLNGLPDVQRRIKADWEGAPISKQNLSEWRLGGFREWHIHHELRNQAYNLTEHAEKIEDWVDTPLLAGKMTAILAARYAALLNSWDGTPNPGFEENLRVLRGLNRDLALLQKTLQQAGRHEIEHLQHEEDADEKKREKLKQRALAPLNAMMERSSLQGLFETFLPRAESRRMAELVAAVKFNLPLPEEGQKAQPRPTPSNPVKPRSPRRGNAKAGLPRRSLAKAGKSVGSRLPSQGRDASRRRRALEPAQCEDIASTVEPESDPSGQTGSTPGRSGEASPPCESGPAGPAGSNIVQPLQSAVAPEIEPAGQSESNPVKPNQSETLNLPVEPQSGDGDLQTAT
jgi:hypothetical protein